MNSALKKLGKRCEVEIIGNPILFSKYKVHNPPVLIVNGHILAEGYVPTLEEMIYILDETEIS